MTGNINFMKQGITRHTSHPGQFVPVSFKSYVHSPDALWSIQEHILLPRQFVGERESGSFDGIDNKISIRIPERLYLDQGISDSLCRMQFYGTNDDRSPGERQVVHSLAV